MMDGELSPGLSKKAQNLRINEVFEQDADILSSFLRMEALQGGAYPLTLLKQKNIPSAYLLHDPDLVREIFIRRANEFVGDAHPYMDLDPIYSPSGREALSRPSLNNSDSDKSSRLECLRSVVEQTTEPLLDRWRTNPSPGTQVALLPEIAPAVITIMGRALFGVDLSAVAHDFYGASLIYEDLLTLSRGSNEVWQELQEDAVARAANDRVYAVMKTISDATGGGGLISAVSEAEIPLLILRTFLNAFAGVTNTLSWTVLQMAHHGDLQQELAKDKALLSSFLLETLRYYPVAWLQSRTAVKDCVVSEIPIRKGTRMLVCVYAYQRDPRIWEDGKTFNPKRFMGVSFSEIPAWKYLPFGCGPKRCVGMRFAMMTMTTILEKIVRSFKLAPVEGVSIRPAPRVGLRPFPDAIVRLSERESAVEQVEGAHLLL